MCLESNLASSYAGVRTVVLGASGFIGRWVARTLCKSGAHVFLFVLDRAIAEPVFLRIFYRRSSHRDRLITIEQSLQALQISCHPSCV